LSGECLKPIRKKEVSVKANDVGIERRISRVQKRMKQGEEGRLEQAVRTKVLLPGVRKFGRFRK
jgi:hypothetical protein